MEEITARVVGTLNNHSLPESNRYYLWSLEIWVATEWYNVYIAHWMARITITTDSNDEVTALLLQQEAKLDDGSTGLVIQKHDIRYFCNVCSVYISSVSNLKEHMNGRNHTRCMLKESHPAWKFEGPQLDERKMPTLGGVELAPGEPVPPGFEDEVKRVPEIMETLNAMKSPLLGLEFLAELIGPTKEPEIRYICMLCDKKGTRGTVMQHLVCFNHRIRYVNRYFPRTFAALQTVPKIAKYRRGTGETLSKIAREIEAKFGRFEPLVFDETDFDEKKSVLFQMMMDGPHAVETPDCPFATMVNLEAIDKISSKSSTSLQIDNETLEAKRLSATPKTAFKYGLKKDEVVQPLNNIPLPKETEHKELKNNMSPVSPVSISSLSSLSSRSRSRSRSPSRSLSRDRRYSRSPKRRRFQNQPRVTRVRHRVRSLSRSRSRSRSPSRGVRRRSPYYRNTVRRSPPRYARRTSPLRSNGARPTISSFKIKTTPSFSQKELDEEHARKGKIRQFEDYSKTVREEMSQKAKLYERTPEKHPLYSDEWKKFWNKRYKELIAEGKNAEKYDFTPEWVNYWHDKIKEIQEEETMKRLNAFRADLGLPVAVEDDTDDDVIILPQPPVIETEPDMEEDNPSLTHVLRLLAALEDQLGSFRVRVNAVFTKALSLEKVEKCSAETLLDAPDIVVLLEGVKEKLKGQLFTGVIDRHLTRGTKKAIQGLAGVLTNYEKKKQERLKSPEPVEPLVVPGVGIIDKDAIAQQIAATLVAQGRVDLTDVDLEQLINAVVGITQPAASPPLQVNEKTTLQSLLSSVVAAQSANDNLLRLQKTSEEKKSESDLGKTGENKQKKVFRPIEKENRSTSLIVDEGKPTFSGRLSPFALREGGANPVNEEEDDDDYSYEEIFKAAKKNVKKDMAKKKHDKQVALKMIDDQQKLAAETVSKPAVVIDPDDLLNGFKSSMAQNSAKLAPTGQPPPGWENYQFNQQQYDYSADPSYNYTTDPNYQAQNNYQQQWTDPNAYNQQAYDPNNGYDYSQQMYNVPPPDSYNAPQGTFPQTQYPNYY